MGQRQIGRAQVQPNQAKNQQARAQPSEPNMARFNQRNQPADPWRFGQAQVQPNQIRNQQAQAHRGESNETGSKQIWCPKGCGSAAVLGAKCEPCGSHPRLPSQQQPTPKMKAVWRPKQQAIQRTHGSNWQQSTSAKLPPKTEGNSALKHPLFQRPHQQEFRPDKEGFSANISAEGDFSRNQFSAQGMEGRMAQGRSNGWPSMAAKGTVQICAKDADFSRQLKDQRGCKEKNGGCKEKKLQRSTTYQISRTKSAPKKYPTARSPKARRRAQRSRPNSSPSEPFIPTAKTS